MMYAAPQRRTTNRPVVLDVPVPTWMRAPGRCAGMLGLEVAMDELAVACAVDPIALRVRNEPQVDPRVYGQPHAFRHVLDCLQLGAGRFNWDHRDPAPRSRLQHGWWTSMGVASATYPDFRVPDKTARIRFEADGTYVVQIAAAEIGTGSWTALTQIAARGAGLSAAMRANGNRGLQPPASLGRRRFVRDDQLGWQPSSRRRRRSAISTAPTREPGAETEAEAPGVTDDDRLEAFLWRPVRRGSGQRCHRRDPRLARRPGVFSVGRVIHPVTARSQFIGGMTMGIGMALHERGVMDPRFGTIVNHDFADYHIPTCADVEDLDAIWLEEALEAPSRRTVELGDWARSALSAQQPRSPMPPTTRRASGRGTFR